MKIFFVGMPGSGKSTIGKQVADLLQVKFIDLDHEIEKSLGLSISSIFELKGEGFFRRSEAEILRIIAISAGKMVIATGGGTPCFHDNMEFMNEKGTTFFLNQDIQTIAGRFSDYEIKHRPLFSQHPEKKTVEILEELLERRLEYYQQAKIELRDDNIHTDFIIPKLNLEI